MQTQPTPEWVERTLQEADELAERQIAALRARRRVEAAERQLSKHADELVTGLCILVGMLSVLFALAFVNV